MINNNIFNSKIISKKILKIIYHNNGRYTLRMLVRRSRIIIKTMVGESNMFSVVAR